MVCENTLFPFQMAAPTSSLRDETMFTLEKAVKYIGGAEYLPLLLAQDPSAQLLYKLGYFFQELSRRLALFGLQNYLHEVVTPGVPEFANENERVSFWSEVCRNNLNQIKLYIHQPESLSDEKLKGFTVFFKRVIAQLDKLFTRTIWLGWNSIDSDQ